MNPETAVPGLVAGGCSRPVRLAGRVDHADTATGELRRAFGPDVAGPGVVHVRCLNRRASACAVCSAAYKGDARQIVMSGLAGGKGVPESVAGHPALFVTLTAPSFGAVHSRRTAGGKRGAARTCRTRRGQCGHGRALGCRLVHAADDPRLGEPVCAECYDYAGQVVWNAMASALWQQTRQDLESAVASAAGLPVSKLRRLVRLTFVKVAEMQARGVVHFHAVIRADGRGDDPAHVVPPPEWATGALLAECLRAVVPDVSVTAPDPAAVLRARGGLLDFTGPTRPDSADADGVLVVRWGAQLDVRHVTLTPSGTDSGDGEDPHDDAGPDGAGASAGGGGRLVGARRTANYLAKYTTKSTDDGGVLDRPVRSLAHLSRLELRPHARRLVETCLRLALHVEWAAALDEAAGRRPGRRAGVARWAHAYGFGSHWVSKSRWYSTTFGALRQARRDFGRHLATGGTEPVDAFGRPDGDPRTVVVAAWAYAGRGQPPPDPGPPSPAAAGLRGTGRAEL